MAENTNYIGIAMGMDVTDLKAGISEANKQIQLANSQFKAASSGMDDWTKSTEGLSAKVKQLESVLSSQKSKLAGLKAEYEKVAKEQGEGSEAARKLQVQINNQQAVVNKTQKEFDNFSDALEKAENGSLDLAKAVIKANGEVKEFGDGAGDAGEKVKGGFGGTVAKGIVGGIAAIGAAALAAVGSFLSLAESTRETRENMNKLETGFTTAGHTAEDATNTYRELYGILGDEGQATEAAAHLAQLTNSQQELSQWTNIAAGVYATFGDSLPIEGLTEAANETAKTGKITGSLADALNWAGVSEDEFQAKLDATTTEQERQALITETLNGLYSEQSDKFKELNADIIAAREADASLAQVMAELGAIAEPIMTTLKLLAVDLLNAIKPFVQLIGEGLSGALNGTAGATDALAEGLSGIFGAIVGKITEILPTVISTLTALIPQIVTTLLNMLPTLLETLITLVLQITTALSTMLPQIITAIMAILPLLIEQLIAAIPQLLQAAITLLMSIVQAIPTIITNLIAALPSLITTIIDALIQSIPILLDAAIQLLNAIIDAIPVILDALITNLPQIIDAIINGVLDALPLLLDAAITLLFAIIDAIPVIVDALWTAMPQIIEAVLTSLSNALPKLFETAKTLLGKILDAVGDLVKQLPSKMGEVITSMVKGLTEGISKIKTVGTDIIKGLWEGIKDMSGWIGKKIKGFGENVLGGIKSFFGIASPSKLIEEEVGVNIGKAFVPTRPSALAKVKKQLGAFSDFVASNLGDVKAGLSLETNGGVARGSGHALAGNTVVNAGLTVNYNGTLSRKQIKQQENDHYTAIRTRLKAGGAF